MINAQKLRALSAYLVAAHRAGDDHALGKLVKATTPRLMAHARRLLGDAESAHDCVQEAWGEIIRALHSLKEDEAFLPWALCIVSRRAARMIRGWQKDRVIASQYAWQADSEVEHDGPANAEAAAVHRALAKMDGPHRATLALFYLEDMNVAEVATALNIPAGTVKTRLMHARKKLRAILEGETS